MKQKNETLRIAEDRAKFKAICKTIGYNNAVEGDNYLNSVNSDYKKVLFCRSLVMQQNKQQNNKETTQINKLLNGDKIVLGGVC